ncbi:replication initiation protein, partial [Salmonella enterica subsp. enterica serovar Havana]
AQIKKLAVYQKEFIDANTGKMSPNDRRDYPEIFEDWKVMLKDPKQAMTFHKIQELLDRQKS